MYLVDQREYWETRLSRDFSLHGVGYMGCGNAYNKWAYRVRRKVFLRLLKSCRLDFPSIEVLDIGSGTGFFFERWKELGVQRLAGSDITNVAVERLRNRHPGHDFHRLDIGAGVGAQAGRRFDAISCIDVLYHIVDDDRHRAAIENIYSLLKPGGLFVLSDDFVHGETSRSQHCALRTLSNLTTLIRDAGFEIVTRRPMLVLMDAPVDSESRMLRSYWKAMERVLSGFPRAGRFIGALQYPLELALVSGLKESPTTEFMLCKKPEG